NMTPELEEARSIGWQLAATKDSTGGVDLPPDSFGHNGFTGTCVWIDPSHGRVFILLTNRTHAHALPFANINALRREFNSRAVKGLQYDAVLGHGPYHLAVAGGCAACLDWSLRRTHPLPRGGTDPAQPTI